MSSVPPSFHVLIVHPDRARSDELARALEGHVVTCVGTLADAASALARGPFDVVLAQDVLPDGRGIDALAHAREAAPSAVRIAFGTYAGLGDMLGARRRGIVQRALQAHCHPDHVRKVVDTAHDKARASGEAGKPSASAKALTVDDARDLILWTTALLSQVKGVVIRQQSKGDDPPQLQFVVSTDAVEDIRTELVTRWHVPIKMQGAPIASPHRKHPVARMLGELEAGQEIFAARVDGDCHIYVLLLPWSREPRTTVAVGVHGPDGTGGLRAGLAEGHQAAVDTVSEFPLTEFTASPGQTNKIVQSAMEYDWVVTDGYVGPDRRGKATSLFNRFVLIGRRKRVARRVTRTKGTFVDGLSRTSLYFAIPLFVFSTIDTVLTYIYVRSGVVVELNPILRPLLAWPWAFVAVKYSFTIVSFVVTARFQLFRAGPYLLGLVVLAYLLLDVYWATILL